LKLLRLVFDTAALRAGLERGALARIIVKWSREVMYFFRAAGDVT